MGQLEGGPVQFQDSMAAFLVKVAKQLLIPGDDAFKVPLHAFQTGSAAAGLLNHQAELGLKLIFQVRHLLTEFGLDDAKETFFKAVRYFGGTLLA